jgi:hypothetical protein
VPQHVPRPRDAEGFREGGDFLVLGAGWHDQDEPTYAEPMEETAKQAEPGLAAIARAVPAARRNSSC